MLSFDLLGDSKVGYIPIVQFHVQLAASRNIGILELNIFSIFCDVQTCNSALAILYTA